MQLRDKRGRPTSRTRQTARALKKTHGLIALLGSEGDNKILHVTQRSDLKY